MIYKILLRIFLNGDRNRRRKFTFNSENLKFHKFSYEFKNDWIEENGLREVRHNVRDRKSVCVGEREKTNCV